MPATKRHGPEVPTEEWGARVAEVRPFRRLSQRDLGEAVGVAQQSFSTLESGEICPVDRVKIRLARVLDVPTTDLFPRPPGA